MALSADASTASLELPNEKTGTPSQKKSNEKTETDCEERSRAPLREWNVGSANKLDMDGAGPVSAARGAQMTNLKEGNKSKKLMSQRDLVKPLEEAVRKMEEPLRIQNMHTLLYIGTQFFVKDLVVVPEDTKDRPLSEKELEAAAEEISSYYHDKENAYDIQPSYGILYKSRQKIEVVLKKDMRHGAKDRLLIQSMPISEKRLYEERIDRNLFFNGAMVSHDWVEVEVVGLSCKDNVGEGLPFRDYRRCKSE